jgi:hypothetical protein
MFPSTDLPTPETAETPVPDRVISVPLSREAWRAFLAAEPHPVQWLQRQIARTIARQESGS